MLRAERLVTDRPGVQMKAGDGTFVEVFEWASAEAIERAHHNDAVQKLWTRFAEVCDHIPAAEVPEASKLFSEFSALPAV